MIKNSWFDPFYILDQLKQEEITVQKNVRDFCKKELQLRWFRL